MARAGRRASLLAAALLVLSLGAGAQRAPPPYFPAPNDWQRKTPAEAGVDAARLRDAIDFCVASEARNPRDLTLNHYQTFGREPFGYPIGPIKDRGDLTGLIVHRGYIVAEWGEPARIDMAYSVTKSMLSTIVGIAFDRGLIRSIDDPVRDYVPPIVAYNPSGSANKADHPGRSDFIELFETPHNRTITWNHLLRQTSDWEGTLWGKPDWADRPSGKPGEWMTRPRNKSGTTYKYNDTRVNVLALAALGVWRRALPQVLKENVMDPIGASSTWRWFGYENSFIVLDAAVVQSVSGGGHWGGGLFINAYDMARFGYLTLRRGKWKDRQLVSTQWIDWALTPTPAQPDYGFMNFYNNRDGKLLPSAPASSFMHIGNGTNAIIVIPDRDLVIVVRWIDEAKIDEFVKRVLAALPGR
jgi:CubicO group peptidase (beta-lactamase class C family)